MCLRNRYFRQMSGEEQLQYELGIARKIADVAQEYQEGALVFDSKTVGEIIHSDSYGHYLMDLMSLITTEHAKSVAEAVNRDRHGYPVLWAPIQTGGETEGAYIERWLDVFEVPYQVVPLRSNRTQGTIIPHDDELRERINALRRDYHADRVLAVVGDDVLSTGLDVAIAYDEFDRQRAQGGLEDVKIAAFIADRIGVSDHGYSLWRSRTPTFRDKQEMLDEYRACATTEEFKRRSNARRHAYLPENRRTLHRTLQAEERALSNFDFEQSMTERDECMPIAEVA